MEKIVQDKEVAAKGSDGSRIRRFTAYLFRPNISRKILFGYLTLAALIVVISVFALITFQRLNRINESIIHRDVTVIEATDKMIDSILAQELYARRYVILKSSEMLSLFLERSKDFDLMVERISALHDKEDLPLAQLTSLHNEYNDLFVDGFEYLKTSSSTLAQEYNTRIQKKQEELILLLKEISSHARRAQNDKMLLTEKIGTNAFKVAGVLCILGIILSVTAAMIITRNISSAIRKLKFATQEISEGRFEYHPTIRNRDELGDLSVAFGEMAKRLKRLEEMYLDASPLTRLPGGIAIENILTKRLNSGTPLAFCLVDMDDFKAFNDHYGYARSSELIKALARIIEAAAAEIGDEEDFVGHIGGDDFVIITSPERYPQLCGKVIEGFDEMIREFYDPGDLAQGYIIAKNRQGQVMKFPIMTISIAVVTNQTCELNNPIQVGEMAAELKEYAKSIPGSVYVVDKPRREHVSNGRGEVVINYPERTV
jgi:GGDEF domain-containing protein/CHASE3 domain sensor protein